jgi:hypothetical protein
VFIQLKFLVMFGVILKEGVLETILRQVAHARGYVVSAKVYGVHMLGAVTLVLRTLIAVGAHAGVPLLPGLDRASRRSPEDSNSSCQ